MGNIKNLFSFDYPPFFAMDQVLSHMDDPKYGIKKLNNMDRIAHNIHMHMMWQIASPYYAELLSSPPDTDMCPCLLQTYKQEVRDELTIIAREIRTPEEILTQMANKTRYSEYLGYRGYYGYRGYFGYVGGYFGYYAEVSEMQASDRSNKNITLTDVKRNLSMKSIKNEETWNLWKAKMHQDEYEQEMARYIAYYVYCQIRE